jgi:5-methylcytosine-specific restriction endonuclease McrA
MADQASITIGWREKAAAKRPFSTCKGCGQKFQPRGVDRTTYCSRACAFASKSAAKASAAELEARRRARADAAKVDYAQRQCACGQTFKPRSSAQVRCSVDCSPLPTIVNCMVCGSAYAKRKYDHGHCSVECRVKWRKLQKNTLAVTSGRRSAYRRARKLKQRGVTVEPVNPIRVLQRDNWRCQLCGMPTPRRLRGTYDDRAPEVDHIVPLAKGGEHSYRNVQCACRKCNLAKADTIKGQMLLFG